MQFTAGRHAQEYNQRKKRKGAYWEDRYHATAIQTGDHFLRCLVYIDLNMVRAGVVSHPSEWVFGGYNEIQPPRRKCILIDHDKLGKLSGCGSYDLFKVLHKNLIANAIENDKTKHDARWSQSIAVGEIQFVKDIKNRLGSRALGRKTRFLEDGYELREDALPYTADFDAKNDDIAPENTYKWATFPTITVC